jgi:hypothetical protein
MALGHASRMLVLAAPLAACLALGGCATDKAAMQAFELSPRSLKERQIESRRFEGTDQTRLLVACQALLQDMGFHTEESESKLGLLVASADREAGSTGEVIGSILLSHTPLVNVVAAMVTGKQPDTWDTRQKVRASLVVSEAPSAGPGAYIVRVTFQRIIWDNHQKLSKQEWLGQPELYQDFFNRLSKAVFLEAQQI